MAELKEILLEDIIPDPDQPRKVFDQITLQELADSIAKHELLQPISVVTHGPIYKIVFGERRWRASKLVMGQFPNRNRIKAYILNIQGSDVLEKQIIENEQRDDVNPMEQAASYKVLESSYSIEEIGIRVGKSPTFIAQRLKLCELADVWQGLLLADKMKLSLALKLARLPKQTQVEVYKEAQIPKDWQKKSDWFLSHLFRIENHEQDLNNAKFKLNDKTLFPEAGACNTCTFNSNANKLLFPEIQRKKICHNPGCFSIKTSKAFIKAVESALIDPDMIFFNNDHYPDKDDKFRIEQVENLGIKVWGREHLEKVEIPESPGAWEEYFSDKKEDYDWEEGSEEDKIETEREFREEYDELLKEYQVDLSEYEREVAEGRFKKAFIVAGNPDVGEIVNVRIKPQKAAALQKQNPNSSDPVLIEAEKNEVEAKIVRLKELGREKVYKKLIELLNPDKNPNSTFFNNDANLSKDEYAAFLYAIADNCSYVRDYLFKHLKIQDDYRKRNLYTSICENQSSEVLQTAARIFIYHKLINANDTDYGKYGNAAAIYNIGKQYFPTELEKFEKEQVEKDKTRNYNLKQRLDAIIKKQNKHMNKAVSDVTSNENMEEQYEESHEEVLD